MPGGGAVTSDGGARDARNSGSMHHEAIDAEERRSRRTLATRARAGLLRGHKKRIDQSENLPLPRRAACKTPSLLVRTFTADREPRGFVKGEAA